MRMLVFAAGKGGLNGRVYRAGNAASSRLGCSKITNGRNVAALLRQVPSIW